MVRDQADRTFSFATCYNEKQYTDEFRRTRINSLISRQGQRQLPFQRFDPKITRLVILFPGLNFLRLTRTVSNFLFLSLNPVGIESLALINLLSTRAIVRFRQSIIAPDEHDCHSTFCKKTCFSDKNVLYNSSK